MCQEDPAGHWPKDAGADFSVELVDFLLRSCRTCIDVYMAPGRITMIATLAAHATVEEVWHV